MMVDIRCANDHRSPVRIHINGVQFLLNQDMPLLIKVKLPFVHAAGGCWRACFGGWNFELREQFFLTGRQTITGIKKTEIQLRTFGIRGLARKRNGSRDDFWRGWFRPLFSYSRGGERLYDQAGNVFGQYMRTGQGVDRLVK